MVYDPRLADRIRSLVAERQDVTEKEMFGGLAFLKDGQMFCCILGRELLARVGAAREAAATRGPHARSLSLIGYAASGCVLVEPGGLASDVDLANWVDECAAHATACPERQARRPGGSAPSRERRTGSRRP